MTRIALVSGLVSILACSSSESGPKPVLDLFPDGGPPDSGASDAGAVSDAAPSPVCPAAPPTAGAKCAPPNVVCEYGADPDPSCNASASCTSAGTWEVRLTSGIACPTPPATASCPATYAAGRAGAACTNAGLQCAYSEGRCACARPSGGDGGGEARWTCDAPQSGCPTPRPRLGSACSRMGQICNYGACVLSGGMQIVCLEGYWQTSRYDCQGR